MSITRFAPTPNGSLHLGHVVNLLFISGIAYKNQWTVKVRLEDHDKSRATDKLCTAVTDCLSRLSSILKSPNQCMIQSQNLLRYDEVLENLKERDLVFGCECSRKQVAKDLEAAGEIGLSYPGTCKNKQLPLQGPSTSLRLKTDAQPLGGLLLRNRNGAFSFDFCNVIDDQDQGIAHIIRGLDLLELEPRQEALGTLLFGSVHRKATYMYHPLIFQSKTQKLSKSLKGRSVESMLDAGWDTPSLIGYCAFLIGLSPNPRPMDFSEWVASGFQKLVQ